MKIGGKSVFTFLFFISVLTSQAQNNKWPSTLLWRISGNGLTNSSWLYGTMHLQDKRLFKFSDSLYKALEKAEGFAIEVDFHEFIDSIMRRAFENAEDEMLGDTDTPLEKIKDKTKERSIVDSLLKFAKEDKKVRKQLAQYRRQRLVSLLKYGEMPTIMDAYLYGLARKQGKWLGAVEDVRDQLGLYDEIGSELEAEELTAPDEKLRISLEEMIKIYLAQDLQTIEDSYINKYSDEMKDKLLLKRNEKMARSMDSLSNIRSMFYAVGAAHLPGEKGVIKLLRDKGYTVDPVFSAGKTEAEKYAATLTDIPWITMIEATDSLYSIDLPGIPSEYNLFGELVKMKVYADITTMTVYMTGHTIAQTDEKNIDKALDDIAVNMKAYGKPQNKKQISINGVRGTEGIVSTKDAYYKIQLFIKGNILYMLMAGSDKRANLLTADANRFFGSFAFLKTSLTAKEKEWVKFSLEDKAFSIMLPGNPKRNRAIEKGAEGSSWRFTVHDFADASTALYYLVQVRDIAPGYYLDGDSAWFSGFRELLKNVETVTTDRRYEWQGFPAYEFGGLAGDDDIFLKTKNVIRGNRVYTLMVAGNKKLQNDPAADRFFRSLSLLEYKRPDYKKTKAEDGSFETWAGFPMNLKKEDEKEDEYEIYEDNGKLGHYISYNPNDAISYEVIKELISPYIWYENDSAFFKRQVNPYINFLDSVVSHTVTFNGKLNSREWLIEMPDNTNLKKIKMVLNGDTLYTLYCFIPKQYIKNPDHARFFDDFRVVKEVTATSIFTNKADKLFTALESGDSATFTEAADAFKSITFTVSELPHLHKGLMNFYLDDTTYYSIHDRIIDELRTLADSSTINFVRNNYKKLSGDREKLKKGMLAVLAAYKTQHSYDLLKELLLNDPPKVHSGDYLAYRVSDSLQLGVTLFPEVLKLAGDTILWQEIVDITRNMLDSSMISKEMLMPYRKFFVYNADTVLHSLKETLLSPDEDIYGYEYLDLLHIIGSFKDDESNNLLRQYLLLNNTIIKQEAILILLKNGYVADKGEFEKVAADKYSRKEFYDALKELGKEHLFPEKYRTQRYFAEAMLFSYAADDYEPSEMIFLGEKTADFNGKKSKFYLFRIVYEYEGEEDDEYLGVAGPYSLDQKDISSDHEVTSIQFDENYEKKKEDKHFKELLKKGEKYLKDKTSFEK